MFYLTVLSVVFMNLAEVGMVHTKILIYCIYMFSTGALLSYTEGCRTSNEIFNF